MRKLLLQFSWSFQLGRKWSCALKRSFANLTKFT